MARRRRRARRGLRGPIQAKRAAAARRNCPNFGRLVREARANPPMSDLLPLFNHWIHLASDSAMRGNCKRAGQEIGQAKKLTRHGKLHPDDD